MADTSPTDTALHTYTRQVLSGTGLTAADVTAAAESDEGTAAHALQHGWDLARRAAKVLRP